nr:hypothetical protein BaRGS_009828 [Batillaria attramentaria]
MEKPDGTGMDNVTTNGLHSDDTNTMTNNGMGDMMTSSADPMTMSGLFSRDLDLQYEGADDAMTSNNAASNDAFGGCGMTDSFIQQEDSQSASTEDTQDAFSGCGMTDSFMQLANGSTISGTDQGPASEGMLIDFGLPPANAAATTATTSGPVGSVSDGGVDAHAAMFGGDYGGAAVEEEERNNVKREEGGGVGGDLDDYHPGQPSQTANTNPFATEEPAHLPPPPTHHPVPPGIDLLIQSAPPPNHPFAESEEEAETCHNPFSAGQTQAQTEPPQPDSFSTNPFAQPETSAPQSRMDEQREGGEGSSGEAGISQVNNEGDGAGDRFMMDGGPSDHATSHYDNTTQPAGAAMEEETEISAYNGMQAVDTEFSAKDTEIDTTTYTKDMELSAAPGAPRGREDGDADFVSGWTGINGHAKGDKRRVGVGSGEYQPPCIRTDTEEGGDNSKNAENNSSSPS